MKYNISEICTEAQRCHREGVGHQVRKMKMENEILQVQNKMHQSKLKVHEDREKRRIDGLKKAQAKKKAGSKRK